jgi:hypothetical protein
MGMYIVAKEYLQELKKQGNSLADETLQEYEEIKTQSGEFIAAKYLADIYREFQKLLKEASNG